MSDARTRFHLTTAERPVGRLALLTMDNGADHTRPTTFDSSALASLAETLDAIEADDELAGLVLTGKPFVFAAGADLTSFGGMDAARARQAAERGHELFARLQALPFPTLAAINGVCMGGGMEIALHCDVRTVSSGARALAFPEVFLSIVPAWGGTQLVPRLVGAADAVEAIIVNPLSNNRVMRPREAFERGFADRLYDSASFLDDSVAFLERLVSGEETVDRSGVDATEGLDAALATAVATADGKTHGATRAPYVAIELIEHAARGGDLAEGRRREQEALAELLPVRQAQCSVYAFDLTQRRVKKQPWRPDAPARKVRKVAIVGAGLMGAQLGALHLQRLEVPLVMKDVDEQVLDQARGHIEETLDVRVAKGRLSEGRARFLKGQVTYTTAYEDLAGADWVLEAAPEQMDLKREILGELEQVVDDEAILATNTSSLPIGEMAAALRHPERVLGVHFFNPVAVMPLVEVIRHDTTSDEALSTAFELAGELRKSAVACADAPGFIVNRLLMRFNLAATRALRQGSDFHEIDRAIERLGLPMGPFALFGLVGLQVAMHVVSTLAEAFPDRFEVDENLRLLGESGLPGVYDRAADGEVYDQLREHVVVDEGATPLDEEHIQRQALEAVADEARRMLDEHVVADARDIDTAMLLGAGYPFFNGGICCYLDQTGISEALFGRPLVTLHDRVGG